jgi:hypothetical protein
VSCAEERFGGPQQSCAETGFNRAFGLFDFGLTGIAKYHEQNTMWKFPLISKQVLSYGTDQQYYLVR